MTDFIKALVERVLRDPNAEWTVQGFGMMRTYFGSKTEPKRHRLNVWDSRLAVPDVSVIHDHPWHFESLIVAGRFYNTRYNLDAVGKDFKLGVTHHFSTIKTGIGGDNSATVSEPTDCILSGIQTEIYFPGDTYSQRASEIHKSAYEDGTVTLNERLPVGTGEHARVFWPVGTKWVDASPRPATPAEVAAITENALKGF